MAQVSIVPHPKEGTFYRNAASINPYNYDVVVEFTPESSDELPYTDTKQFTARGLDFRTAPTEAAALEEAKYKLGIECRTRPNQLTEEQIVARDDYMRMLGYFEHAKNLVDWGVMAEGHSGADTTTEIDLSVRLVDLRDQYNLCVTLGIYYAGNYKSGGHI